MAGGKLLVYLLRRDLRVSDNPILHHLATSTAHGYTHLLPVFIFPSNQIEISGFLKEGQESPYPSAVSQVGKFWRCGPHRAKFLAQAVWDVKQTLESLESGLLVRVGSPGDVLQHLITGLKGQGLIVDGVWMTEESSYEEQHDQDSIASICSSNDISFKLWSDEKYFIDDRDTGLEKPSELPDVFTSYRKSQEPLRERPRPVLLRPQQSALPKFLDVQSIPPQDSPFLEASSIEDLEARLLAPLGDLIPNPPQYPENTASAHPFRGGESSAWDRLNHLIKSGAMTTYNETRNGLMGLDYSTKLSAFLALGCVSARQIHKELLDFENGTNQAYEAGEGYGEGENEGTRSVRFELLWRDYMRLCMQKFGRKLFRLTGSRDGASYTKEWKTADKSVAKPGQKPSAEDIGKIVERFLAGITGMGLIDASQRELFHTGYTSNRARQNVASFFSKHMGIDWRYGAEWYEMMLTDYDPSSNWGNWQYVAGIGNDPRGDARIFNPVKQAFDYDKDGSYVRAWVPEARGLEKLENVFQPCTASQEDLEKCGIANHVMVTDPIKRIEFLVDRKPKAPRKTFSRRRGHGRGGRRGGGAVQDTNGSSEPTSRGPGSSQPTSEGKREGDGQKSQQAQQPPVASSQTQRRPMHSGPGAMPHKGMMNLNGFVPHNFPPPGTYDPRHFGDGHWFSPSWIPTRGRGYGGGYRGRGGRRGNSNNYNNRGGFGGAQYNTGYPPGPAYFGPQNMGPTV